ncbi:MAG: putative non-canonical purine NTP phosphatase [Microgenomates group bacterium GW2011_GWA2_46_7]|nr:MAG: putative non-canonical purine NTP phosphatase [Microgenomates group bacterium GW2011_GWA2_46_7]
MRIIVGSKNPVKIGAVQEAFRKYWSECEVVGVDVESGVSSQPISEKETINGARQRAYNALKMDERAEYGVGLEGGVTEIEGKMFECAWVAIVGKVMASPRSLRVSRHFSGTNVLEVQGLGGGLYFELPEKIADKIRQGGELGPIMEETMKYDVKRTNGAIGVLTKDQLKRKDAYVQIVLSALIKFVSPEWYH